MLATFLLIAGTLSALVASTRDLGRVVGDSPLIVRAAECQFRAGFKTLHELMPNVVGECLRNEQYNPENGDSLQPTTNGLLVWRKADNWTAFTNGSITWINGPGGLVSRPNSDRFTWETPTTTQPTNPPPPPGDPAAQLVDMAIADAAQRLTLDRSAITLVRLEPREWSDASIGCPRPDMMYAQVITPGYLIVLSAGGQELRYHADSRNPRVVAC